MHTNQLDKWYIPCLQGLHYEDDEFDPEDIEIDYEMGEILKDKVIPDAVHWFTGEALQDLGSFN